MKMRHFGRTQQMWVLVVVCLVLFGRSRLVRPGHDLRAVVEGHARGARCASVVSIVVFQIWLSRVARRAARA